MLGKPRNSVTRFGARAFLVQKIQKTWAVPRQDEVMTDPRLLPMLAILNFALIL